MANGNLIKRILGKILPRNYEVGEPTGPGAEETLERRMPPRGQKKPAKPTSKGDEVRTEEPPRAPEQPSIEEPIKKPSGQAPSVKHEEPAQGGQAGQGSDSGQKVTPAGESSVPGKPTGGGGKIPGGASTGKLTGFPAGAEGGAERINQYLEGIEKIAKSAWREEGRKETKDFIQKLIDIGRVKGINVGGTAVLISGIALASLVGLGTLTGKSLENLQSPPGVAQPIKVPTSQSGSGEQTESKSVVCAVGKNIGNNLLPGDTPGSGKVRYCIKGLTGGALGAGRPPNCNPPAGKSLCTVLSGKVIGVCTSVDNNGTCF